MWVLRAEPIALDQQFLDAAIENLNRTQRRDPSFLQRINTMARFFSKAIVLQPSEEKYILLWTILEIFPMKDTSNIRPISEYLGARLGRSAAEVKELLGIGRLCDTRNKLVHDGRLPISAENIGAEFALLENICLEVLRAVSGVAYAGPSINILLVVRRVRYPVRREHRGPVRGGVRATGSSL